MCILNGATNHPHAHTQDMTTPLNITTIASIARSEYVAVEQLNLRDWHRRLESYDLQGRRRASDPIYQDILEHCNTAQSRLCAKQREHKLARFAEEGRIDRKEALAEIRELRARWPKVDINDPSYW